MAVWFLLVLAAAVFRPAVLVAEEKPANVILMMSDDQGWGDAGYNGHKILKTPHLDAMVAAGLRFNRFYSSSPVCSPTRGSCLTGRHPNRYGILYANAGYLLPKEEITLAEVLSGRGYRTGHFGKWHLGDFEGKTRSAPSDHGFDEWFSTARKVATLHPDAASYRHNGNKVEGPLKGDDSKIIMDKAIPFIRSAVEQKKSFFAVIWFHTPHLPILAAEKHRKLYPGRKDKEKHYWGALTAMDEQVGRLRETLRELDVARDTMLWFTSDNGPEGKKEGPGSPGTTGGLRGRKRSLFEGGVRVPGSLELAVPARKLAQSGDYAALLCLGCVIRGETTHYDTNLVHARAEPIHAHGVAPEGKHGCLLFTHRGSDGCQGYTGGASSSTDHIERAGIGLH